MGPACAAPQQTRGGGQERPAATCEKGKDRGMGVWTVGSVSCWTLYQEHAHVCWDSTVVNTWSCQRMNTSDSTLMCKPVQLWPEETGYAVQKAFNEHSKQDTHVQSWACGSHLADWICRDTRCLLRLRPTCTKKLATACVALKQRSSTAGWQSNRVGGLQGWRVAA